LTDRFRDLLGFFLQRQISLGNDSDDCIVTVHDRYASYLVLLHGSLTLVEVFAIAARYWAGVHESLDRDTLRVQSLGHYRAAEIAVSDYTYQLAGLLIRDNRHRTYVLLAHNPGDFLGCVRGQTAQRIRRHHFADFHKIPPVRNLPLVR